MENLNTIDLIENGETQNGETQNIENNVIDEESKETKKRGLKKPSKYPNGGSFKDKDSPWYRSGVGKGNGVRTVPKKIPEPKITIKLKEYNDLIVYKDRYNQMVQLLNKE